MSVSESLGSALRRYRREKRRGGGKPEHPQQRLDIQGLRMVAVLLVFATHLFGWPRGGFVGVDVFFVISGYLITGNLLRTAEKTGNVSFRKFYWNRVRRIIPAATAVLILTYLASVAAFLPFRAHQVGVDAVSAFFFVSNWRFAAQETDYFASGDAVSPIQHYWSLSIEEQFYFVWPALIFLIGLVVARKAWTHSHRMRIAGAVMGLVVAISLGWALYETAVAPTWAYFNTFTRVWELGIGALLATAVGLLARIPMRLKPWLSWAGLGLIAASVAFIAEGSPGFPAPWALLPVAGSALVIAAGVGGEPAHQGFLRNPVAVYVGNISYSLYLVHWPVIVILGALFTSRGGGFYVAVVALAFGLAIASYHFVENPLRYGTWNKARASIQQLRRGGFRTSQATGYRAVAILALLTIGVTALAIRPPAIPNSPPDVAASPNEDQSDPVGSKLGPAGAALQRQIVEAVAAKEWPPLEPSMQSVINGPIAVPEVEQCGVEFPDPQSCTWGPPTAPTRIMLVGDSDALAYGGPLRELAMNSGGEIQVRLEAMPGCPFVGSDNIKSGKRPICPARKQRTVEAINTEKPDVVIISNSYGAKPLVSGGFMTPDEWAESMRQIVETFQGNTKKVVWLSPPPETKSPSECFGKQSSVPADCLSQIDNQWYSMADAERNIAASLDGAWIDAQPWFCSSEGLCPAFVGSTAVKRDDAHITPAYGAKIVPAVGESLASAGVIPRPEGMKPNEDTMQPNGSKLGPLGAELRRQIDDALKATQWPRLDPSMESVIDRSAGTSAPEVARCGGPEIADPQSCTWGSPTAPTRVVIVGDSIALGYGVALRKLALNSTGKVQLRVESMYWCAFIDAELKTPDQATNEACEARKRHAIDVINTTKPQIVVISNRIGINGPLANGGTLSPEAWADSMRKIADKFRGNVKHVVWMAAPPETKNPADCYGTKSSVPADCVSQVNAGGRWLLQAQAEQDVADAIGGQWVDSQPWFCSEDGFCPAFVGPTPTYGDEAHMTTFYADKIFPVIGESLKVADLL